MELGVAYLREVLRIVKRFANGTGGLSITEFRTAVGDQRARRSASAAMRTVCSSVCGAGGSQGVGYGCTNKAVFGLKRT